MLTAQAIEDFKVFIDRTIAYAKVTINGTESKQIIHRRERLADGRVAIYLQITPGSNSTVTIQKVRLYNTDNQLWAEKNEDIKLSGAQEGALYRFVFGFEEMEV